MPIANINLLSNVKSNLSLVAINMNMSNKASSERNSHQVLVDSDTVTLLERCKEFFHRLPTLLR